MKDNIVRKSETNSYVKSIMEGSNIELKSTYTLFSMISNKLSIFDKLMKLSEEKCMDLCKPKSFSSAH